MRGIWLRFLALVLAFIITVSASGCGVIWDKPDNKIIYFSEEESTDEETEETEETAPPTPIYVTVEWANYISFTDEEKEELYNALVKLISNEEQPIIDYEEKDIVGYAPPRPDEPSITMGVSLGLFDVTLDGFPELFVDLGGGSAGNAYYYVYDIITGEMLGDVHGGVATSPAIYLNLKTGEYEVIERYTYRGGATAISESIGMLIFDDETNNIREKNLFCSFYVYDWIFLTDENGNFEGSDLEISEVGFFVDDESSDHEDYHYFLNYFESTHSLIPNTSMRRVSSYDFREYSDSPQIKAEKIANALVYESEQKFVKMDK